MICPPQKRVQNNLLVGFPTIYHSNDYEKYEQIFYSLNIYNVITQFT